MQYSSPEQLCSRLTYPLARPSVLTNCHSDCKNMQVNHIREKCSRCTCKNARSLNVPFFVKSTFHMHWNHLEYHSDYIQYQRVQYLRHWSDLNKLNLKPFQVVLKLSSYDFFRLDQLHSDYSQLTSRSKRIHFLKRLLQEKVC